MKKFTFVLVVLVVGINCVASQRSMDPNDIFIQAPSTPLKTSSNRRISSGFFAFVFTVLKNSIDNQCVLDEYEKHNATSRIPSNAELSSFIDGIENSRNVLELIERITKCDSKALSAQIYIGTALSCSTKFNLIADYVYEFLMMQNVLYKALENETNRQIKKNMDIFPCANRFAINENIVDSQQYQLPTDGDLVDCDQMTEMFKGWAIESGNESCCSKNSKLFMRHFTKYFLLIQVEMTPEQKQLERKNFERDAREVVTNIKTCFADL